MSRQPFIYSDEMIDLGDLGEHELVITALDISQPGDGVRILIKKAMCIVRMQDCADQELNVTFMVQRNPTWLERVKKSYEKMLGKDWEADPLDVA